MIISQLAKNIRFLRKRARLSQQALGEQLNLSRSNIASYENGKAEPKATKLVNIAKYFQVNLSHLIEIDLRTLSTEELEQTRTKNRKPNAQLLVHEQQIIDEFLQRSNDLNKILNGFKEFYKFKIQHLQEMSEDVQSIIHDFENLLNVMESVQQFNQELIDYIQEIKTG